MARQEGIIQLTGGVGYLSFYKGQDGYLVRRKSGVSRERIMSDPAYARTRENIAEFTRGARATKLLRRAFSSFVRTAADNRMTSRLTSAIMQVIKTDAISVRGERNVTNGEVALLKGFEFNKHAGLAKAFGVPFTASIDRETGVMTLDIPAFSPDNMISAPEGATHFRLKAVGAAVDFGGNTCSVATSESDDIPITDEVRGPLRLSQTVGQASTNTLFLVFGIEFLQLVNGAQHPLRNGTYNATSVVSTDGLRRAKVNTDERDREASRRSLTRGLTHTNRTSVASAPMIQLSPRWHPLALLRFSGYRFRLPDRRRFLARFCLWIKIQAHLYPVRKIFITINTYRIHAYKSFQDPAGEIHRMTSLFL